jgi:hypothetical protein
MENGSFCIVTFSGTHRVLKAARLLKNSGLTVEAIAAPRHISTECGICIRLPSIDINLAHQIIGNAKLEINGVYNEK